MSQPSLALPYLPLVQHQLPFSRQQLSLELSAACSQLSAAQRLGQLWLVMQESSGDYSLAQGQRVSLANIEEINWFSDSGIMLSLNCETWGNIDHLHNKSSSLLQATPCQPWRNESDQHSVWLAEALRQAKHHFAEPVSSIKLDDGWLCYRWLELLPFSVQQKQTYLTASNSKACKRMLVKMLRGGDLFA